MDTTATFRMDRHLYRDFLWALDQPVYRIHVPLAYQIVLTVAHMPDSHRCRWMLGGHDGVTSRPGIREVCMDPLQGALDLTCKLLTLPMVIPV